MEYLYVFIGTETGDQLDLRKAKQSAENAASQDEVRPLISLQAYSIKSVCSSVSVSSGLALQEAVFHCLRTDQICSLTVTLLPIGP